MQILQFSGVTEEDFYNLSQSKQGSHGHDTDGPQALLHQSVY